MQVIPAIDLKGGRCVRLAQGREDSARIYDTDPIDVARFYEREGARLIHIVDLDGAFLGAASENQKIIRRIASNVNIPIQAGGGVRSLDDIRTLIEDVGAAYIVLGTLAVEEPKTLEDAIARFGDSIVVGIDARGRSVATRGWTETTQADAIDLARQVASARVARIVYTDISRDGELAGPNIEMTREIASVSRIRVTASGGVSSLEDIDRLRDLEVDGVDSVIVGKALYEGRFGLAAAINRASQSCANVRP